MLRCVNRRISLRQILPLRMEEMQSANAGFWNFFVDKYFIYIFARKLLQRNKKYNEKTSSYSVGTLCAIDVMV